MKRPCIDELPLVYLKPGEMYIAQDRPALVTTVLGSCISASMFSERFRIGAICHGLLPNCRGKQECDGTCTEGFRYVDCSIRQMAKQFDALGVLRGEIKVKLFGGADMFTPKDGGRASASVGRQNIETAMKVIMDEGLTLVASDVGGVRGRKILFYAHTGEVLLKRQGEAK